MKLTAQEKNLFDLYGYKAVHVGVASITICRKTGRQPGKAHPSGHYMQLLRERPVEEWIQCLKLGFVEQATSLASKLWSNQMAKTLTAELVLSKLINKANAEGKEMTVLHVRK